MEHKNAEDTEGSLGGVLGVLRVLCVDSAPYVGSETAIARANPEILGWSGQLSVSWAILKGVVDADPHVRGQTGSV
jgi:hypothetical protein